MVECCQSRRMLPFHTFWTPLESTLERSSMWRMRPLLILLSWIWTWQSPFYSHLSCGGAQMVSPERPCWRYPSCCQTNPSRMTTSNAFLRVRRGAASASKNWLGHWVTSPRKMPCPKWGPCAPDVVSPLAGSTWLGCTHTVQIDRLCQNDSHCRCGLLRLLVSALWSPIYMYVNVYK